MKLKIRHLFLGFLATGLVGCAAGNGYGGYGGYYNPKGNSNYNNYQSNQNYTGDEEYNYVPEVIENPFVNVSEENKTSNVSLTSSSFSYSILRQAINRGNMYNAKNSARIEEMLNYFSYGYINDTDDALVTKLELDACPWNNEHYLASVVVKAKPAITENVKNNIVILVDKSGSMNSVFSLVKKSLHTLVDNLGEDDVVSIVSYASTGKIECEGLTGKNKTKLNNVIDGLESRGSTYGEDGIEKAYNLAYKYFINGGNNRVVLLTDGDFNVGKVSGKDLTDLIKQKAADGVYLTCCGYRSNNNDTLYTLADNGNGNAYYIDDELEATKVFEEELGKSLYVVAKDAKCQIEFSNDVVSYRLLGYETRQMSDEEFEDDKKDAGEIMSDHTTVALYELELKTETPENFFFKTTLRYKDPTTEQNKEVINTKTDVSVSRRADFDFASYVAEYALTLTESKYKGTSSYTHLLERINDDYINDKYRDDFKAMVNKTKQMNSDY
jgi:Ca-activated chloride channel family protein